jgi:hypothetical protein
VFRDNNNPLAIVAASKILASGDPKKIYQEKESHSQVENVVVEKEDV